MSRTSASEHIRRMEKRIEDQLNKIERLRQTGGDSAEERKRLTLLQRALEEMHAQLGSLSPTPMDSKRHRGHGNAPPQHKK
jgi:regulator of replication initiation timing